MKNIHVIPTDKPSRLYLGDNGNFVFGMIQTSIQSRNDDFTNQNIYITSNEEIKEGDWLYDLDTKYVKVKQSWENSHLGFNGKKIILTTDSELQKDGVQAIPDEFLEWFVKNSSCELVEVTYHRKGVEGIFKNVKSIRYYGLIIPKEEPKSTNCSNKNCQSGVINGKNPKICRKCIPKEEPKQETLEEAQKEFEKLINGKGLPTKQLLEVAEHYFIVGYETAKEEPKQNEDMSTLETQYKNFLKDNLISNLLFEEWKQINDRLVKQALINTMKDDEELGLYDEPFKHKVETIPAEEILANRSNAYEFIDFDKQETFEEFIRKAYLSRLEDCLSVNFEDGVKLATKWNQERSYSEANKIIEFLDNEVKLKISDAKTIERVKWYFETYFEQFKKK